jgi:hypothetical protein
MKILGSEVSLASQHIAVQEHTRSESLKVWVGNQRPDFEHTTGNLSLLERDRVNLSSQAKAAMHNTWKGRTAASRAENRENSTENDPVSMIIRMLAELITGKKIKITSISAPDDASDPQKAADLSQAANQAQTPPQPQPSTRAGFGLEYDSLEKNMEAERTNFSAQGMVRTVDGRQIEFNLQLSMERVFMSEESVSVRLGDAAVQQKDPLLINFSGTAAQLTEAKFSFDIDTDGEVDEISFAEGNSGFLALDNNGDGEINNGSELFGANSGNGFQDLSAYDQDKNGWIDESDSVFSRLKVWSKDEQGTDFLTGLKETGVGALYLGNISTPFELKNGVNESLGTVRASGVYLAENGSSGTLQQVDLTL